MRSVREKSLEILRRDWELNPGHGEDRLSYNSYGYTIRQSVHFCSLVAHYSVAGSRSKASKAVVVR